MKFFSRFTQYIVLMRLNKPIGILLLLWPTCWALWLAGEGHPQVKNVFIFVLGVIVTRSLGCVVNDIWDRNYDPKVTRTANRPLAAKTLTVLEAVILALMLALLAFIIVLFCNALTIFLSFIGLLLAVIYPLLKRVTYLPQLGLGATFSWGVPMAFAAEKNAVPYSAWCIFSVCLLWPIIYDTMYAMVDQTDDLIAGVKSTAILFGKHATYVIGFLQGFFLLLLIWLGHLFHLSVWFYLSLMIVALLFIYQLRLLSSQATSDYFRAFTHNHWVGAAIFTGILLSYYI